MRSRAKDMWTSMFAAQNCIHFYTVWGNILEIGINRVYGLTQKARACPAILAKYARSGVSERMTGS